MENKSMKDQYKPPEYQELIKRFSKKQLNREIEHQTIKCNQFLMLAEDSYTRMQLCLGHLKLELNGK